MSKKIQIKESHTDAITKFVDKAKDILSDDLEDILIYGSVARGKTHPGHP